MFKKLLLLVSLVFIANCVVYAQEAIVEVEGRYWMTDLTAKAKIVSSSIGSDLDFKSDLGLEDENFPEIKLICHRGPNNKYELSYTQIGYSADKIVTRNIEFSGNTYTSGSRVTTDLDIKYLSFVWVWQFINLPQDKLKFGTVAGVKALSADMELNAPSLGISKSDSIIGGLPVIGAALDINPISMIGLFAEVSGLSAGSYGYFLDAEAGVKLVPIRFVCLTGGYRLINMRADRDSDFAEIKFKGPFVGGVIRF